MPELKTYLVTMPPGGPRDPRVIADLGEFVGGLLRTLQLTPEQVRSLKARGMDVAAPGETHINQAAGQRWTGRRRARRER